MTKWTNFPRFFGLKRHATMDYHSLTKDNPVVSAGLGGV